MNKKKIFVGCLAFIFIILGFTGCSTTESDIEEAAMPLVSQVLQEQYEVDLDCEDVIITESYEDNTYDAKATLNDSSVININIEYYPDKDNYVYVEIPYEEMASYYY